MENHPPGTNIYSEDLATAGDALPGIADPVIRLEGWIESMRQPGGYGGAVVEWGGESLEYTGPGLDWRYEGIILGYLNLWAATYDPVWLEKACRAGDDLVAGQLPSSHFRNSSYGYSQGSSGNLHAAACDLALLRLAEAAQAANYPGWQKYLVTAERNLCDTFLDRLWDRQSRCFWSNPEFSCFVPDKAATLLEAFFAYALLTSSYGWIETYILPTIDRILAHQIPNGELKGAIYYSSTGKRKEARFFPYHVARCIPALIAVWEWTGDARCASAARRAAQFILNWQVQNGGFYQVIYSTKRQNRFPQWIAATGDILRALDLVQQVGLDYDPRPALEWLLAGQRQDGGIRTAFGFGKITPGGKEIDPRDEISVCGWAGKAFRYLSGLKDIDYN